MKYKSDLRTAHVNSAYNTIKYSTMANNSITETPSILSFFFSFLLKHAVYISGWYLFYQYSTFTSHMMTTAVNSGRKIALLKAVMSSVGRLPEGVPEVNAPSFQLFRVVGGHVGKFSKDVQVGGVTWWERKKVV